MEPSLHVRAFGNLELLYPENRSGSLLPLLPGTLKSQSLLAYPIVRRRFLHSRNHLAELFWGERREFPFGELKGIAPTGKQLEQAEIWLIRLGEPRDSSWMLVDGVSRLQQLGVLPS